MLFDNDTFEVQGLTFRFNSEYDIDCDAPWEREDGHGPVTDWRHGRDKAPGERVLCSDRGSYRFYDWAEASRIAKRDGWGLGADDIAKLAHRLGRAPTKGDITAEAVQRDFDHIRDWCNDQWHYIGVTVTLMVEDDDGELVEYSGPLKSQFMDALWGIEDSEHKYVEEVAHELAESIASQYHKEAAERAYWAERDVATTGSRA